MAGAITLINLVNSLKSRSPYLSASKLLKISLSYILLALMISLRSSIMRPLVINIDICYLIYQIDLRNLIHRIFS